MDVAKGSTGVRKAGFFFRTYLVSPLGKGTEKPQQQSALDLRIRGLVGFGREEGEYSSEACLPASLAALLLWQAWLADFLVMGWVNRMSREEG